MRARHWQVVAIVTLALAIAIVGCRAPQGTPAAPPAQPTSTPEPQDPSGQVISGQARVEEIEILILESFPVQVNVVARGNLPDGCTTIDRIDEARQGNTFVVTITTVRPADRACTEALVPFEEVIALEVARLDAGAYTVEVNGVRDTFELAMDNRPRDEGHVPGCAEAAADETLFLNRRAGYCFLYPAGFEVILTEEGQLVVSPPRTGSVEVPQASLTIERTESEQTLEEAIDALQAEYPGVAIGPAEAKVGGEQAAIVDTLPGIAGNWQAYFRHGEALYHLVALPIDAAYPEESEATEQLWATVVESWAFVDPDH